MCEKKAKKCSLKCKTCEHYSRETDFCKEKEIEGCSKQVNTDFSQCGDYLVDSKLVMF